MSVPNVLVNIGYAPNSQAINRFGNNAAKRAGERKFYSSNQDDDFVKYVGRGIAEGDAVGYMGNPEKSSGVFNENGLLGRDAIKKLRLQLRVTDSNIWHTVISFTEVFGEKYMTSYEDAMELLKAELPQFFKSIGIDTDNVEWFAGLHTNTDNRHIHLAFFEKEPRFTSEGSDAKRYRFGTIGESQLDSFRVHIEERLTDVAFELKRSRRNVSDTAHDTLFHLGMTDFDRELKKKLLALYRALPLDGRVSYGSKNMDALRGQVDDLTTFIIKNNPELKRDYEQFCSKLARRDAEVKRMCDDQKIADCARFMVSDKYLTDVYRRLGDKVIKAALTIKIKGNCEAQKCRSQLKKKQADKRHRQFLFDRATRIAADVDDEAVRCFEEFQRRLQKAEYDRLVEEGIIEAE